MRKITKIIVHCSATRESQDIGAAEIKTWHLAKKWNDIGYHYVIRRNGTIEAGRPLSEPGAHCPEVNDDSIGICLVGTLDFTVAQVDALLKAVNSLRASYGIPPSEVFCHYEFPSAQKQGKTCPNIPGNVLRLLVSLAP